MENGNISVGEFYGMVKEFAKLSKIGVGQRISVGKSARTTVINHGYDCFEVIITASGLNNERLIKARLFLRVRGEYNEAIGSGELSNKWQYAGKNGMMGAMQNLKDSDKPTKNFWNFMRDDVQCALSSAREAQQQDKVVGCSRPPRRRIPQKRQSSR